MVKKRVIDGVHKGKDRKSPKSFWNICATELTKVFSEIISDSELLKKCYCQIRSRDFDEEFLTEITTNIPSAVICSENIQPDEFLSKNLSNNDYMQPYLIINDVGTGKTTYLYYHFLHRLQSYNLSNMIDGILINMKEFGGGNDIPYEKIEEFFHKKINQHLTTKYPKISSPNIETGIKTFDFELIPYAGILEHKKKNQTDYENFILLKLDKFVSDLKLFNRARIRFLNKEGKRVFIVIDNVDHYSIHAQEKIFSLSTKIMNDFKTGLIMSARDYTIPFAFRHVPLSAFEPRFLHLALPDTKGILQKRITYLFDNNYIEKIFNSYGTDQIKVSSPSGNCNYLFNKLTLKKEFDVILDGLLNNEEICNMLQNLSDYDMRAMLKMVIVALSSGYIFPEDREQRDTVRANDFLRAIMCGNNPYFFPDDPSTMVLNLFDDYQPNLEYNNLIRLRTLQTVNIYGKKASVSDILQFMASLNYPTNKVTDVLQILVDWDLIESPFNEGSNIKRDDIQTLKLTFAGHFYLESLIYNPVYLQEIKNSTYITDSYLEDMKRYMERGLRANGKWERILFRLEATKIFIKYLQEEERLEEQRIMISGNNESLLNYEKIEKISKKIFDEYDEISKRVISSV